MNEPIPTDPYSHLTWVIGSGDDFWCFDYCQNDDASVTLHALLNSESGHFIEDAEPPLSVPANQAVAEARRLTESALDWCAANGVDLDTGGWNQDPSYFWRCVQQAVSGGAETIARIVD